MKYIAVFCSANDLEEKYTEPAKEFARLLVQNKFNLVWGGSDRGLMKVIASTVQESGGKIVGVSMELLQKHIREGADEMIIEKDLTTRKATILKRSDAIALLVGGLGSLDEVTEILELKKHGVHNKPIVVLNTENFYEGLKVQLKKMKDDGFLTKPLDDLIFFADTPEEAIVYIQEKI